MEVANYRVPDTKAWPGKISIVVAVGSGSKTVKEVIAVLQSQFTVQAVVFTGDVESQSDLPIIAKKMKLKNKLVRVDMNGTNPGQLKVLMERGLVDYVSLWLKAPLYAETYGDNFEAVRQSVQLLEGSKTPHEIVLNWGALSDADVKDAASQVTGTFVLYADKGFDELGEMAKTLAGPKRVRIRNKGGEQSLG